MYRASKLSINVTIAFCLCLTSCLPAIAGNPSNEAEEACLREELMFRHIRKMADGTFSKNDFKACEYFLAEAISAARTRWLAILARYQNIMEQNPLATLTLVAPVLVGEDKARQWKTAQAEAEQKEKAQKGKPVKSKQPERSEPQRLFASFPPAEEWIIDRVTADCAVEATRAHLALKEYETALDQINYLGPKLEELARVLVCECGGDLLMTMQRYEQAVRFYGYALYCLNEQRKVPLDKAAAEKAGRETDRFITDNEFGLYRGEMIEAKADYCLEILYDPAGAAEGYILTLCWETVW
ncbi:MAG: hypothetical protein PHP98_03410 [Kiritimatiellae bacterium]|jgi:tetratricopeptide (TPR) repeat protein|nr:hypothetical protein [Kiritimatiellia bacterium]